MSKRITCTDHFGKTHSIKTDSVIFRPSVYGVLKENNHILLVKARHVNKWEFPGGGVQPDESIEDALKREYKEETGFQVEMCSLTSFNEDYFYCEIHKKVWLCLRYLFWVNRKGGSIIENGNNDDITKVKFIPIHDISQEMMKPNVYSVFEKKLLI